MKIPATYRTVRAFDDWQEHGSVGGQTVHEREKPSYSPVLGPDGAPLEYEYQPLGFDLRGRDKA